VIRSFRHKGLEDFYCEGSKKRIQPQHADKLGRILERLDSAEDIQDLNYPGSGLHLLEPKKQGRWAVKVSGNWRITFNFEQGGAWDIDYEDYH